jgi:fructose-1,6-bisphosphatase/inositol monophosphatase family enzyme
MSGASLVVGVALEMQRHIMPLLADSSDLADLGAIIADRGYGHTAHEIDRKAEAVLFKALREQSYSGLLFSEESGLVRLGNDRHIVVCDPYCNTTLTFRGIRESAIAVYEYTRAGKFTAAAIADMQIRRLLWADDSPGVYLANLPHKVNHWKEVAAASSRARCSDVSTSADAFLTISLLKRRRRENLPIELLRDANMVNTIDGAIAALRVAVGETDGFIDAEVGQPSYEALAYVMVAKAGGVVTDPLGAPIEFGSLVEGLANGEVARHRLIAAANRALLDDILRKLPGA